jgi:hypothetical protein
MKKGYVKLSLMTLLTVATLSSVAVGARAIRTARPHDTEFFSSSGARVADFVANLPTNAGAANLVAHPIARIVPACARKADALAKIETLLGLSTVVHAQSYCDSNAPCIRGTVFTVVSCSGSCSGGTMTQTDSGNGGTTTDGSLNCGGTAGCGCEVTSC